MRALLAIPLLVSCGGSRAERSTPPEPRPWVPYGDCAGPKANKCGSTRGGDVVRSPRSELEPIKEIPDAVEAGPTVYTVVLENDEVRVLQATYQPGAKVPMHRHPDRVVYALTGAAVFEHAGQHEVEVTGASATRAILVELGAKRGAAAPAGDDPVMKLPRIYKLLLDETRVRVLDVTFGKGTSKPVALGDHVLLSRDKGTLVVTPRGASEHRLELEPGKLLFCPAGVYTATNPKRESFEVVLFELKP